MHIAHFIHIDSGGEVAVGMSDKGCGKAWCIQRKHAAIEVSIFRLLACSRLFSRLCLGCDQG